MNPTVFIDILNQEDPSDFNDIKQLDRLLKKHPYFQIGLAAKSRYLKAGHHIDYVKTSRKAAVIFPDRAKLHQFLNQRRATCHHSLQQKQHSFCFYLLVQSYGSLCYNDNLHHCQLYQGCQSPWH